ncbi:MAG: Serine/threonine-protein kinase StkP [Candidatus Anoxychlamydiales bacterium]|nr:Serine/threonine-protein kinase StkP [Candidatus Anoxychlamydiales bacterium]
MENKEIADQPTIPTLTKFETPIIPKKIGPYRIESLLKKGGMSFLYLGVDPENAKPIVIKVLSPKFIKNTEVINRFLKEADIIRLSNHPNIIKLYGQGQWDHGLYIAMEFVQGISLKQFLLEKSLSVHKALEIILQVGYALCHLHTHGIIHRDLKPENILITENGQIKVIDFGISALINEEKEDESKRKSFMGTPVYMSPEQKEDPKKVTFSSDIYSLAVITYELLLGKLSFGVIHLSLIPKKLRLILEKALQNDPKKRYQDIVDFITDLSEYLKSYTELEDTKNQENYDERYTSLVNTDRLFLTKDIPAWKHLEIAAEYDTTISSFGLYTDFFQISENIFACILAKSEKKDLESYIHTSIFRGYVKMAISIAKLKKEFSPANILSSINTALEQDLMDQKFFVNLIVMNLDKDQILYSNSFDSDNYFADNANQKCTPLSINNPILSKDINLSFIETTLNFKIGDEIILLTKKIKSEKQDLIKKQIIDNMLFSCHNQAEKIILTYKNFIIKKENDTFASICIQRKA